jgi:hypothetical protein
MSGQITVSTSSERCYRSNSTIGRIAEKMMSFVPVCALRSLLLGLFLVAQPAGVIPLMYDHTLNVYETTPVAGHNHAHPAGHSTQPDADHHHGVINFQDQCCTIDTMSGPMPSSISIALVETAPIQASPAELIASVTCHPARLDRPPKSLSAV